MGTIQSSLLVNIGIVQMSSCVVIFFWQLSVTWSLFCSCFNQYMYMYVSNVVNDLQLYLSIWYSIKFLIRFYVLMIFLFFECWQTCHTNKCQLRIKTSSIWLQSNLYIKKPLKGTWKCAHYEQFPFMYRLKLYALFINGKNETSLF